MTTEFTPKPSITMSHSEPATATAIIVKETQSRIDGTSMTFSPLISELGRRTGSDR
jgi:hypothetical protein